MYAPLEVMQDLASANSSFSNNVCSASLGDPCSPLQNMYNNDMCEHYIATYVCTVK